MDRQQPQFEGLSDAQIVEEVLLGKTDAFELLFDRYAKKIFGYLWHFSRNRADCEDHLQETFYKAYVNLKYCREREKFSSWLFAIAHNVAVSGVKRLSLYYKKELPLDTAVAVKELASGEDLTLRLARQENIDALRMVVRDMPSKYKEVVVLFYYNDSSLRETSDILKLPLNTVKTRLHRARAYLSEALKAHEARGLEVAFAKAPSASR